MTIEIVFGVALIAVALLLYFGFFWVFFRVREKLRDRAAEGRAGAVKGVADILHLQFRADGDPGCIEKEYAIGQFILYDERRPR
jgi:hypothetical protein